MHTGLGMRRPRGAVAQHEALRLAVVTRLLLLFVSGFAGDNCILLTAHDAYMRGYRVSVPADCTASESAARNRQALEMLERTAKADVTPSERVRLPRRRSRWSAAMQARADRQLGDLPLGGALRQHPAPVSIPRAQGQRTAGPRPTQASRRQQQGARQVRRAAPVRPR